MYLTNRKSRHTRFAFEPSTLNSFLASNFLFADYEEVARTPSCPTFFRGVQLGAIDVFKHEGSGTHRGYRRLHHFREDRVDDFLISLPLRGLCTVVQGNSPIEVTPGSFIISSTSRPFVETSTAGLIHKTFESYQVRVSGSMLRARVPHIDRYCHHAIRIVTGAGEIMRSMFSLAIDEGPALTKFQSRSFGNMLIDAIANAAYDVCELLKLDPEPPQSSYLRIRENAKHFIASNLSDPYLNPAMIASYCNVSVRCLHLAFESSSDTVASVIRESRLLQCRNALRNPQLRDYSVFTIASRWGFKDQAHFSRAYKARFGLSPKHDRCIEIG